MSGRKTNNSDFSKLEDFDDFFENSLCGFVFLNPKGVILKANSSLAEWLNYSVDELKGKKFSELLSIGGKIYYETHLWPLLKMQKFFQEVALELIGKNKEKIPVLVNALERSDENNQPQFIRITILKSIDRLTYEQNLLNAKIIAENKLYQEQETALLREQFIAILGHDLRNPLQGIIGGASVLSRFAKSEQEIKMAELIQRSATRMRKLIDNIMDFARARLGNGLNVDLQPTLLQPVVLQVIDELRIAWPDKIIEADINIQHDIMSDGSRIAQLISNLLANAITHGSTQTPILIKAFSTDLQFELSVTNNGTSILPDALKRIFLPFKRESEKPSQQGLGLGLFIASEIAKGHNGKLEVKSENELTCFTLIIPKRNKEF